MKKHIFKLKKLILLSVALVTLFCLAACGKNETPPLDSGTEAGTTAAQEQTNTPSGDNQSGDNSSGDNSSGDNSSGDNSSGDNPSGDTPPADDRPIVTELPLVSYYFVSNGDGTCSIGGIITNPQNNTEEIQLDIPEISPDGDTVTAINDLSFEPAPDDSGYATPFYGAGNVPRMLLEDDFKKICAVLESKVASGEITQFQYLKFKCYYTRHDLAEQKTQEAKDFLLEYYPITAIKPIYVLASDLRSNEIVYASDILSTYVDYDIFDCITDFNYMVETAKASELCTKDMLSKLLTPYANSNITFTGISIPKSVTKIRSSSCLYNRFSKVYISDLKAWCELDMSGNLCSAEDSHHLYLNGEEIINLSIPEGTKTIAAGVFHKCESIQTVSIPNTVNAVSNAAFLGCKSLESIVLPDSVTSIGTDAFGDCNLLIQEENGVYYVGNWVVGCDAAVENFVWRDSIAGIAHGAFMDCKDLTSITIPENMTCIGPNTFSGCTGLKEITIPDSVTSIGENAFQYCTTLTSITISNSVTSISDYAFYNCSSLTSITIPDGITSIGEFAFTGCSMLEAVSFGDDSKLTSIGERAFRSCMHLTSITIPKGVTSIGKGAFSSCYKLVEICNASSLPIAVGFSSEHGEIGRNALHVYTPASGTSKLHLTEDGYLFYSDTNKVYLLAYRGTNTALTLPENYNGSTYEIYPYAFHGCSDLTSITIPEGVTSIGEEAFRSCSSLTSITISNSVTSIGKRAFSNCTGLTSITIPNSVTSIGDSAFSYCTELTSITIPNSVTSIAGGMLAGCGNLTSITIPSNVTSIGNSAFSSCSSLTSITIPSNVTSIGNSAFADCEKLKTVTFGTDSKLTSIGNDAFSDCWNLKSITIPSNVTSIGDEAFSGCGNLESITIPKGITRIGRFLLYGCGNLTSITIPNTVTNIGYGAFYGCSGAKITFQGSVAEWNKIVYEFTQDDIDDWGGEYDDIRNYTVHCTDGTITKQ